MPALGGTFLMGQFRRVERGDLPQMHVYLQLIFLPDENYIEYLQITLRQKRWSRAWGIPHSVVRVAGSTEGPRVGLACPLVNRPCSLFRPPDHTPDFSISSSRPPGKGS